MIAHYFSLKKYVIISPSAFKFCKLVCLKSKKPPILMHYYISKTLKSISKSLNIVIFKGNMIFLAMLPIISETTLKNYLTELINVITFWYTNLELKLPYVYYRAV